MEEEKLLGKMRVIFWTTPAYFWACSFSSASRPGRTARWMTELSLGESPFEMRPSSWTVQAVPDSVIIRGLDSYDLDELRLRDRNLNGFCPCFGVMMGLLFGRCRAGFGGFSRPPLFLSRGLSAETSGRVLNA